MLIMYFMKFMMNFIYVISDYIFKSLKKSFLFLISLMKKFDMKKYLLNLVGYDDKFIVFVMKMIFLYPILSLFIDFMYMCFLLMMEMYFSMVDGVFNSLFDIMFFIQKYDIANSNKIMVFFKKKMFNLLNKLYSIFSLKFLNIDWKNLYLEKILVSMLDVIFLFLVRSIDFLLSTGFAVGMGSLFLIFMQIFVFMYKIFKMIIFFVASIMLTSMTYLYYMSNFLFKKSMISIYKKFLKIPNIILTKFEEFYVLKELGSKNQLKYFKNTSVDFLQPLSESRSFKKKTNWLILFMIMLSNIFYFPFIFLYYNMLLIAKISMYIWMYMSIIFDYIYDSMEDYDNYNDPFAKEKEDKKMNLLKEENEKYEKYYSSMKFNDSKYNINNYYSKNSDE